MEIIEAVFVLSKALHFQIWMSFSDPIQIKENL